MTDLPCGPGADARYCETFWAQNAELESLREQLAAVTAELDALNASTSTLLRRMASLADALEQSARTTAPSRKSETERKLAKAVREVALDSIASQEPQP